MSNDETRFMRRALTVIALSAGAVVVLYLLWRLGLILLLLFAGILLALFLRALSNALRAVLPVGNATAFTVVVTGMFAFVTVLLVFLLPLLFQGIDEITEDIPHSLERIAEQLQHYPWGKDLLSRLARARWDGFTPGALSHLLGWFSTAVGALTGLLVVLITAIYLGAEPQVYVAGFAQFVPPHHRDRAARVFDALYTALAWWIAARLASMAIVAVLTWLALLLLHVPFAATLALIAGLLSFIPNIGPILAAVPAVLVGTGESMATGGYVLVAYVVVQAIETYAVTPVIQRRAVDLPPATAMAFQIAFGAIYGFLGLLLAIPLALVIIILMKMLYVEPAFGERSSIPGANTP